jgi:glutathione reductase (NADPH)
MIRSACRQCRRTLDPCPRGRELEEVEPGAIVVWSGRRYASGCAASSLCTLQAFCDDDHLAAWCDEFRTADDGIRLCLAKRSRSAARSLHRCGWRLPWPYDLIVIGSGTAAQVAVGQVRAAGWSVAVIDHRPFGGTCALRGCDPKRMLVSGEEAIDAPPRMAGHGVGGDLAIDWPSLMAFKRSLPIRSPPSRNAATPSWRRRLPRASALRKPGRDRGRRPDVAGPAYPDRQRRGPIPLGIPGEELVSTSDAFLELETLPRRIVLIGGGYVAAEFSHLAARAGAEVTILQRAERLLPHFDPDLVGWLTPRFRRSASASRPVPRSHGSSGTGTACRCVPSARERRTSGRLRSRRSCRRASSRSRQPRPVRREVAVQDGRLQLDAHLRSISNPRVYAAGDAAGVGPP